MCLLDLEKPALVRAVGEEALLGEKGEEPRRRVLDELHDLRVVFEGDVAHVDALPLVLSDDGLEHSFGEHALQLLVGEVDAELLKRVARKAFEAKDVDGADEVAALSAENEGLVDALDEPIEDARVQRFGKRVLRRLRIAGRVRLRDPIEPGLDVQRANGLGQLVGHAAKQLRRVCYGAAVDKDGIVVTGAFELGVAQMEDRRNHLPHAVRVLRDRRDRIHRRLQLVPCAWELVPLDAPLVAHVEIRKRLPRVHAVLAPLRLRQVRRHQIHDVIVLLVR